MRAAAVLCVFTSTPMTLARRTDCVGQCSLVKNQSTEGAEFVWVSECQKGEGCEIINHFIFVKCHQCFPAF
jgi:hypothetical protein